MHFSLFSSALYSPYILFSLISSPS
jgi:hypothetical protein